MPTNEQVIREVYAAAEAKDLDIEKFVSLFADDGYVMNMASGEKWTGEQIPEWLKWLALAFPDMHRELLSFYTAADDVISTEVKLRGTHVGDLPLPGGVLPGTGKKFDVPCSDVFHLKDGKVRRSTVITCGPYGWNSSVRSRDLVPSRRVDKSLARFCLRKLT